MDETQSSATERRRTYQHLLTIANDCFQHAIENRKFTVRQAYSYTYDEMELVLRSKVPWVSLGSYTAFILCIHNNGVRLSEISEFDADVLEELRSIYVRAGQILDTADLPSDDRERLELDIDFVRKLYVSGVGEK